MDYPISSFKMQNNSARQLLKYLIYKLKSQASRKQNTLPNITQIMACEPQQP